MKLYDLLQLFIVASAILCSALYAVGRVAPNLRKRCAVWLQRAQQPRLLKNIGASLASGAGGCGDGCSSCGSCTPAGSELPMAIKIIDNNASK